jgi:hypothetical protein
VSEPLKVDEEARCDRCGGFSPFDLGDRRLCEECYRLCGSCCPEFGADDLWPREDDPPVGASPVTDPSTDRGSEPR